MKSDYRNRYIPSMLLLGAVALFPAAPPAEPDVGAGRTTATPVSVDEASHHHRSSDPPGEVVDDQTGSAGDAERGVHSDHDYSEHRRLLKEQAAPLSEPGDHDSVRPHAH